jgi:hypothetical protein
VTPIIDLINEIRTGKSEKDQAVSGLAQVQLIWVSRHADELTLLPSELVSEARYRFFATHDACQALMVERWLQCLCGAENHIVGASCNLSEKLVAIQHTSL